VLRGERDAAVLRTDVRLVLRFVCAGVALALTLALPLTKP